MDNESFHIETHFDPTREEITMHAFQVLLHAAKRIGTKAAGTPRQVSFVALRGNRDSAGEMIGGILGKIQMGALFIDSLWVNPDFQRAGVGTQLYDQVVAFAIKNNCEYIVGTTYDFYDAFGFLNKTDPEAETIGKIENCPAPYSLVFIKRKL